MHKKSTFSITVVLQVIFLQKLSKVK